MGSTEAGWRPTEEKLTDTIVRRLEPPQTGNRIHYDPMVKGFGVRITAAGARSFIVNYRVAGRERRITIGSFPDWSTVAARDEAKRLKQRIDRGEDPLEERQEERAAPTVADLIDRFKEDELPRKRPLTQRDYARWLDRFVAPKLGPMKVVDVKHADLDRLHRAIAKDTPTQANRVAAVVSRMFGLAVRWGMRADNPVKGIERETEEKRARYLTGDELRHLSAVLDEHPEQSSANAVRLLLLTGARRMEVLAARWDMFDLKAGLWVKPSAHTKQKREHRVPLSAPVLELLTSMKAAADEAVKPSEFLFPGADGKGHQTDLKKFWGSVTRRATVRALLEKPDTPAGKLVAELAEKLGKVPNWSEVEAAATAGKVTLPAGLTDVRVHDLRHTFASVLVSAGASLPLIGALLGHTQANTTQRYAHLFDDPLRAAAERVGAVITGASGGKTGEVVQLPRRA